MYPTKKQVATFFDCSEDHVENEIDRMFECSFSALRERAMDGRKRQVLSWAMKFARAGNEKLIIFLLKNMHGWSDKVEVEDDNGQVIELRYSVRKKSFEASDEPRQIGDADSASNGNGDVPSSGDSGGETKKGD